MANAQRLDTTDIYFYINILLCKYTYIREMYLFTCLHIYSLCIYYKKCTSCLSNPLIITKLIHRWNERHSIREEISYTRLHFSKLSSSKTERQRNSLEIFRTFMRYKACRWIDCLHFSEWSYASSFVRECSLIKCLISLLFLLSIFAICSSIFDIINIITVVTKTILSFYY